MKFKHIGNVLSFIIILIFSIGCQEQETDPTSTPIPDTPVPHTPTPSPTNTTIPSLLANAAAIPPKLIGQSPAANEEAPLNGVFEAYFDQPMDQDTTAVSWQITDENGDEVEGEVSWPQPRILRFTPAQALTPNAQYKATVAKTAVNTEGIPLLENISLDFHAIGDLTVSQVSPTNGTTDVEGDTIITVIFSRPVAPLYTAGEQKNLPNPLVISPDLAGQGEWVGTAVYVFRPDTRLIGRQSYDVTIKADIVNDINTVGAQMAADHNFSFTVAPPTFNALELVGQRWDPRTNYNNLPLEQVYRLHFNQAMDEQSTETAVSLTSTSNKTKVPLSFNWNEDHDQLTITPTQRLELSTNYTLELTNAAKSEHGGRLAKGTLWQATTVPQPSIKSTDPIDGEVQHTYHSAFTIYFASEMDKESLAGKVTITPKSRGDANGLYRTWDNRLSFYGLDPSTTYTIYMAPGMADMYGNVIETDMRITFTTAAQSPTGSFNLPYSLALYRSGGSDSLWVTHRNVKQLEVDLYTISLLDCAH